MVDRPTLTPDDKAELTRLAQQYGGYSNKLPKEELMKHVYYSHKVFDDGSAMVTAHHPWVVGGIGKFSFNPPHEGGGRTLNVDTFEQGGMTGFKRKGVEEGMWEYAKQAGLSPQHEDFSTGLFHVSPRMNRSSIETRGLIGNSGYEKFTEMTDAAKKRLGDERGVFVGNPPRKLYGDDIYQVAQKKAEVLRTHKLTGDQYIPGNVRVSDVKRVGHFYQNPNGHTEVHWHPEEECRG
jgi:hypothetical protein